MGLVADSSTAAFEVGSVLRHGLGNSPQLLGVGINTDIVFDS